MAARDYGQYCGITQALELVGERWALLIVRDLLVGPRRYGELAAGLPRIPSNILAARLKELQAAGVIRRAPRSRVILYELTPFGRELEPVRGQLVEDDARARRTPDHARGLELLQARGQDVARDPGQSGGELAVPTGSDEQVAHDEQSPSVADPLERPRRAATAT